MTRYFACYDLEDTYPSPHAVFIEKADSQGWYPWILSDIKVFHRLPNTTLIGDFANMDAAVNALKAARTATQGEIGVTVDLEKWIVTERGAARFHSDDTAKS